MNSNPHEILKDCRLSQKTEAPLGGLCHKGNAEQDAGQRQGPPDSGVRVAGLRTWAQSLLWNFPAQARPTHGGHLISGPRAGGPDLEHSPVIKDSSLAFPPILSSALHHGGHDRAEGLLDAGLVFPLPGETVTTLLGDISP